MKMHSSIVLVHSEMVFSKQTKKTFFDLKKYFFKSNSFIWTKKLVSDLKDYIHLSGFLKFYLCIN